MNRPHPFASNATFKPASFYLGSVVQPDRKRSNHKKTSSLDDSDVESGAGTQSAMDLRLTRTVSSQTSNSELTPRSIPLITISRSPSPYSRGRGAQSDDDEELLPADAAQSRPLVAKDIGSGGQNRPMILRRGGIGQFLFGTSIGSQIYVGLLVFWVGGCQFGLLLMNRFILWTGTYKFPYPLTMTLIQLLICHVIILAFASLTRGLQSLFQAVGLGAVVAPPHAYTRGGRATRYRGGQKYKPIWQNVMNWLTHGSGGIAGGGLFEWQWKTAKHVLPVAVVFMAKVVLSNLSYAYAVLPMYMLARIAVIPLTLIFTAALLRQSHSVQTLSSTLTATLNLLMATLAPGRVTWESIVSGVFSSLFVALYPIVLLRAYKQIVSDLVPQGDILATHEEDPNANLGGTKEESRAYWRTLHYTSLLTIALLLPIVVLSGELTQIRRNCYFLDVPWFWFLMLCGGIGSWAVFVSFLLLIKATSPLSATFVSVPRSVFQLGVLNKFHLAAHSWVGAGLCVASCLWYVVVRRQELRGMERARLEGR